MNIYFDDFIDGLSKRLNKRADEYGSIFDVGGSIFPNVENQTKWHMARTDTHVHLNDGSHVYNFHMPEGYKEHEDFPLVKEDDLPSHEFSSEPHAIQVHRADPGHIYFTLQDGSSNPTFTFKHTSGSQWRAIPKNKQKAEQAMEMDHDAFMKGAMAKLAEGGLMENVLDKGLKGIDYGVRGAATGLMALGERPRIPADLFGPNHPAVSNVLDKMNQTPWAQMGLGLGAGAAYDIGKRTLYNTKEENDEETGSQRLMRYLAPTAAMGVGAAAIKNAFPYYYTQGNVHHPFYNYDNGR